MTLTTNRLLSPDQASPRRLLVLGHGCPDTYLFRTGKGTLGILRLVGLSADGRGVRIEYKLAELGSSSAGAGEATEGLAVR